MGKNTDQGRRKCLKDKFNQTVGQIHIESQWKEDFNAIQYLDFDAFKTNFFVWRTQAPKRTTRIDLGFFCFFVFYWTGARLTGTQAVAGFL